jgi:hypothetical protein
VAEALERRDSLQHLRDAARRTIVERYDMRRHCMPALLRFVGEAID